MFRRVVHYIRNLKRRYQIGGAAILIIAILFGVHVLTRSAPAAAVPPQISHVQLASVASLSAQTSGPLPVTGTVTSLHQASISAQSSGEIVILSRQIGDFVPAGGIIAQLENSSQRAAVLQAQGSYDAAEATFANTSGTTAANSSISASQASEGVTNAQASVTTSMQSLYAAMDDAVHTKADQLFSQPRTNPKVLLIVPDSQLVITLQNERTQLELTLQSANTLANATSRPNTDANIATMTTYAQQASTFLNNLADAINKAQASDTITAGQIAGFQASIAAARTEVTSATAGLSSAKTSFDTAQASAATANNSAGQGTTNTISIAQANVEQAQGALNAAQASLEKTIIRSPISGTIVSLPITQGSFVSANSQVAQVSNPSALEVDAYVTPDDAKTLAVGGKAQIANTTTGVIVSIAPALDPTTGKILVKIGIVGSQSALTDGDTVSVTLARATSAQVQKVGTTQGAILIPIIAAKITPAGPVVFTATASSTLEQVPITLGTILGDQVTVLSGLTLDTVIVTDARGLSAGQTVVIDTH